MNLVLNKVLIPTIPFLLLLGIGFSSHAIASSDFVTETSGSEMMANLRRRVDSMKSALLSSEAFSKKEKKDIFIALSPASNSDLEKDEKDTRALEEAINKIPDNSGGIILLKGKPEYYHIKRTIVISKKKGITLLGEGKTQATLLAWKGPTTGPMFWLSETSHATLSNFVIMSSPTQSLETAVLVEGEKTTFDDLTISGISAGGLKNGIQIRKGNRIMFSNISIHNYDRAGVSFENPSYGHTFLNCFIVATDRFYEGEIGKYGVTTALGSNGQGSSFHWFGGALGGNKIADFYLAPDPMGVTIYGANNERSGRFLKTVGSAEKILPLRIEGVRWSGLYLANDGEVINYGLKGPLILSGNQFTTHQRYLDTDKPLLVNGEPVFLDLYVNVSSQTMSFVTYGNFFLGKFQPAGGDDQDLGTPYKGRKPTFSAGDTIFSQYIYNKYENKWEMFENYPFQRLLPEILEE